MSDKLYQEAIFNLLKSSPRETLYSLALRATPLFRRFVIGDNYDFIEATQDFGWVLDVLPMVCVAKFFKEPFDIDVLRDDLNVLAKELLEQKKNKEKKNEPSSKLLVDEKSKLVFERNFNFKYTFGDVDISQIEIPSWQTIIGPLMWFLLHSLATNVTEEFILLLSHLHLFIGCLDCGNHYYKAGRLYFMQWMQEHKKEGIDLFLIRLHNYVSKHGEVIKNPRSLDLRETPREALYRTMYKKIFY